MWRYGYTTADADADIGAEDNLAVGGGSAPTFGVGGENGSSLSRGGWHRPQAALCLMAEYGMGKEADMSGGAEGGGSPMAGLGFGLPLSRLHAQYFGGNVQVWCGGYWVSSIPNGLEVGCSGVAVSILFVVVNKKLISEWIRLSSLLPPPEMQMISVPGYGTDVYLRIHRLGLEAEAIEI